MAAVSEDPITLWLKLGALEKLEQVVLDGYGDQLYGKTSRIPQVNKFLRQVPLFQNKIDEIHKAVSTGNLRDVQHLIDRKKLAFCRDQMGASPMHKAVLFSQKPIIDYLLDRYPSVVHARDHRGRTPLHYAAVLSDGGEIYKMLLDHGADIKATDVFGNRPEYYMHAQDEMDIQALKEGNETGKGLPPKPVKIKHFQTNGERGVTKSAKPAATRAQIREMLSTGSIETLEDLVIQGHGGRLLGESATNPLVRDFIKMVPTYMERIYEIHRAVARGRLRDVQTLLDRKKLALARDPLGATPLHKAVMYGHTDIAQYIATNFPLSKDNKDLDGRTALHYAAALKDNHETYNMLIALGANPLVLDYRGKTAEYYLQFPEHLHLEQMIKQSQRTNANYMANYTNRMKAMSPKRKSPYPTRAALSLDFNANVRPTNGELSDDVEESEPQKNGHVTFKMPKRALFRSQPLLPPPKLKRLEINSANIKRWVREEDLEKLEGAVLEGYGEKVASQKSDNEKLQQYINDRVPLLVKRIEAIHSAVSNNDLNELQAQLQETDHMVLAKDHFGMAPIHRSVLMNKPETLAFLIDRFPETVNARDKEGRTALHYAAAMSREPGTSNYFKILLEAGADARIRDNQGRSPEYYRTHHVPIPHKVNLQQKVSKKVRSKSEPPPQQRMKKLPGINGAGTLPQVMMDKINQWLQNGDLDHLKELTFDGYGQHLVGKTSWNEDVRHYIKTLPALLMSVSSAFHAVERGDLVSLDKQITNDENLLRSKNADGLTLMHFAVLHDQLDVLNYFLDKYPALLNIKDRNGRTPLHLAGQLKNQYMYTIFTAAGADPMILDQKGRTADFYMNSSTKTIKSQISPHSSTPENDSSGEKSSTPSGVQGQDKPKQDEKEEVPNQNSAKAEGDDLKSKSEDKDGKETTEEETAESGQDTAGETKEDKTPETEEKTPEPDQELTVDGQVKNDEERESTSANKEENEANSAEGTKNEEGTNGDGQTKLNVGEQNAKENDKKASPNGSEAQMSSPGDRLNELIDVWIRDKDLLRLEHVVIAGQGERLIGRSSDDRQVQEFLDLVPTYMARIRGVHDAVVRGNLGEVESVLTRKRFALSRDHLGASPLHLAVLHGHTEIVKYIIDNFPEALDGPDNEGRTPLHYAAVMRDGGTYYRILLMAGADETVKDKANRTSDYYLTHPGALTIRELLEGYRIKEALHRRPSQVNIWQRPPTDEAEKLDLFDEEEDYDPFEEPEPGNTPDYSDTTTTTEQNSQEEQKEEPQQASSIYPILFDRQNKDSRYLAGVLGDALIKGLTEVAQRRPRDPIGYLATYLYHYASRRSANRPSSNEAEEGENSRETEGSFSPVKPEASDGNKAEEGDVSRQSAKEESSGTPLEVLEEDPEENDEDEEDFSLEFEDHTKMKDEEGQTVLHFAAARIHPDGSFYGLLSHAEVLLAERDSMYRTCRDVAEETGQQENLATIDRYVFDAFLQQRSSFIHMLLHEGYDHLVHISDSSGRDVASVLQQQRLHAAMSLLREVADFVRKREELHGFIRNSYLEGVCRLVKSDGTLVSAKGPKARCALHVAVLFQHIGVITALVKANSSSVHASDNLGRTPLHYAMATEKVEKIAKILVKAGALRTTKDVKMRTPLYFFIYKEEIQKLYEEESRLA